MPKKSIAVGNSSFIDLIRESFYYVDKTAAFRPLVESGNFVDLITRPRRFGKTLFMDSLKHFLAIDPTDPGNPAKQKSLFRGLKVLEDEAFCARFMGQVPILFMSLKGVDAATFEAAYLKLVPKIVEATKNHAYLLESPRLDDDDKELLQRYRSLDFLRDPANIDIAAGFLRNMLGFLARHFERQAMLFLDEYDVPLAKAAARGYYTPMRDFFRTLLDPLKPEAGLIVNDRPVLQKAILTGCLRVSKESIFTDVNNFTINTVLSSNANLSACMGFTEMEVGDLLGYYGLTAKKNLVKRWYDGYRFGASEIYSPWDVLSFCQALLGSDSSVDFKPGNYWIGTSSNEVIDEFLGFLTEDDADKMQRLVDGESIETQINEELTYADFARHKSEDFWTLLLFTGYLTVEKPLGGRQYLLRIPNEEIRDTFITRVKARFSQDNSVMAQHGVRFAQAAGRGNICAMSEILEPLLRSYVSVRDAASRAPAENYYQGFLAALLACAGGRVQNFRANAEAGDGYADIVFVTGSGPERVGVVIELKRALRGQNVRTLMETALRQIDERRYGDIFDEALCSRYYAYGIVFRGKNCLVGGGVLRNVLV